MDRRTIIQKGAGFGFLGGVIGNGRTVFCADQPNDHRFEGSRSDDKSPVADWHLELTRRIAALEARGGGTLELGDGVYQISKPLRLANSVSLLMTPNAVIRARPAFDGDAVIIKDCGRKSVFTDTSGWIRGGVIDGGLQPLTGLRVEAVERLEIADLEVKNATYKGIHLLAGGYERNITRVRCDVDLNAHYAPKSVGIQ